LEPEQAAGWLLRASAALTPGRGGSPAAAPPVPLALRPAPDGWVQVQQARARTTSGGQLLRALLDEPVHLRAADGDTTVEAAVGHLGQGAVDRPVVVVALAAALGSRPTPAGFRLAARALRLADRLDLAVVCLVDTPGAEPGAGAEDAGLAAALGEALDALLLCRSPTLALVHGEGGSGGAVALACADRVLVGTRAYCAPIGPEGASATLRLPPQECMRRMRVTPPDLLAAGFADALVSDEAIFASVSAQLEALRRQDRDERLVARRRRWSAPLAKDPRRP